MIEVLIHYGSALYWALLLFGIYLVTIFAEARTSTLRPNIWAGLLAFFVFCFTDYSPHPDELVAGILAYFAVGMLFLSLKWIRLVQEIRDYVSVLQKTDMDCWTIRHMAYEQFQPNNATDGVMSLPPEPYEFRTRLYLWGMYWPSFTLLRFVCLFHKKVGWCVWKRLSRVSRKIYEN